MTFASRGANMPRLADFNQRVVLETIRRQAGDVSRTELAELTGLSPQTVSNVTRRLLDSNLIRETGRAATGPGKPRTMLRLNAGGGFAVGVHLDPLVIDFVVVDVSGAMVARGARTTPTVGSPRHVLSAIATSIKQILRKAGADHTAVMGVGVGAPGPIDHANGVVLDPPLLTGWRNVPVVADLGQRLGLPVMLEKDVVAATIGENWARLSDETASFLYFYLGTGVGIGAVLDGQVLRGASQNFGEVGHLVVAHDGPRCTRCGRVGELGPLLEPTSVVADGVAAGVVAPPASAAVDDVDARFREIWDAAENDSAAGNIVENYISRLAVGVARVTDLLDVREVVFGGPYWSMMAERVLAGMPATLATEAVLRSVGSVRLSASRFADTGGAMGAASLVLDHALSVRPDFLSLRP
ncbi:ROK family transcriptional regulator [Nakamurella aerolata]|uniref:ROK family transcriptional regulator n=1 Tax=Nakamurella aerolata TaxID=1656892 RepID=A0A849A4Z0_9ACTN|nr:ROK family transcriptional regulator [Nakamurella aerolata]NNG34423.1 ROK family transcriptional regulator [Nakamurella aerolata]